MGGVPRYWIGRTSVYLRFRMGDFGLDGKVLPRLKLIEGTVLRSVRAARGLGFDVQDRRTSMSVDSPDSRLRAGAQTGGAAQEGQRS
jgi:hypothetical protein